MTLFDEPDDILIELTKVLRTTLVCITSLVVVLIIRPGKLLKMWIEKKRKK
jgi:hypothetical protein